MRNYILLNWEYLFGDYQAENLDERAFLYYIKLMFFANNGFVANPKDVLDSMGYDIGVYNELVLAGELLTIPGRKEVFITSYFVHTKFNPMSWLSTPFAIYWKGKLWVKKNGVATLKAPPKETDPLDAFIPPEKTEPKKEKSNDSPIDWDKALDELDGK